MEGPWVWKGVGCQDRLPPLAQATRGQQCPILGGGEAFTCPRPGGAGGKRGRDQNELSPGAVLRHRDTGVLGSWACGNKSPPLGGPTQFSRPLLCAPAGQQARAQGRETASWLLSASGVHPGDSWAPGCTALSWILGSCHFLFVSNLSPTRTLVTGLRAAWMTASSQDVLTLLHL